jgi:glutaredoxin
VTELTLLTQEDCPLCDQAKAALARLAADYKLTVREIALDTDEGRQLALQAGTPFPPMLFLDGSPFSYGRVSERKLRKTLDRSAARA